MSARLDRQFASALRVAEWLESRPEVDRVLYPPLPSDPGHALWIRDFTGGASLMGLALRTDDAAAVHRLVDGLELFDIGSSWGGYESLVAMNHMPVARDMDDAVCQAATYAESDDTVLLAPACASFDQFDNYGARGDAFSKAVGALSR